MPLQPRTRLGAYEVSEPIGAGGMGEVYRARDTKLNRDVALKVLPEAVASDPERLARFQREAEVLASLNHPNIAQIYGLEDSSETTALVLELVSGVTLEERIAEGPIPLDEALDLAEQVAHALEAAHAQGIIHRDLKPANVKITLEGDVKVLDFGLAKAYVSDESADSQLSMSPTLTKGTAVGTILGTASYMSPEQAKGKPVDTRTDVWAFGAVLYEMLTGERAFKGEDVSDTLVSVFRDEPDWSALPSDLPLRVSQAMRVCLRKDAKERVRDIAAVRLAMGGAFETEARSATVVPSTGSERSRLPALLGTGLVVFAGLFAWSMMRSPSSPPKVSRGEIVIPRNQERTNTGRRAIAISPDGTYIAYVANRQLYLRAMDGLEAEPLSGTEGTAPTLPFFSPDGQWVGFYSTRDDELKKIALTGGAAVSLAPAENPYGASWSSEDTILYGQSDDGVYRIAASGGSPELVVAAPSGEEVQSPQLLPHGRGLLFTVGRGDWDEARIVVQTPTSGERVLIEGGTDGRYLDNGYLVYALGGNLLAVRFDLDELELTGVPLPLVTGVSVPVGTGGVNFDVSRDGTLVYLLAGRERARNLAWVDRDGTEEAVVSEPRLYVAARISPDGTQAAFYSIGDVKELWVWEFGRDAFTRLTFGNDFLSAPVWMPDSRNIIYSTHPSGKAHERKLYRRAVDGTGAPELVSNRVSPQSPNAITPDGTRLVLSGSIAGGSALSAMRLDADHSVEPLLETDIRNTHAHLSPDGRFIAYQSNVSGRDEVFVRPFPDVDSGRWEISAGGGETPLWGPDGKELFYWVRGRGVMRVAIDTGSGFRSGNPEILLSDTYFDGGLSRPFDITPDGKRFLMIKRGGAVDADTRFAGLSRIIVVQNWDEELKARVPGK